MGNFAADLDPLGRFGWRGGTGRAILPAASPQRDSPMPHAEFVHLRLHTAYSLSQGAVRILEPGNLPLSEELKRFH